VYRHISTSAGMGPSVIVPWVLLWCVCVCVGVCVCVCVIHCVVKCTCAPFPSAETDYTSHTRRVISKGVQVLVTKQFQALEIISKLD